HSSLPRALHRVFFYSSLPHRDLPSFPTRRSSDLRGRTTCRFSWTAICSSHRRAGKYSACTRPQETLSGATRCRDKAWGWLQSRRSEEHTSELQSLTNLVCRLLLEKKKTNISTPTF